MPGPYWNGKGTGSTACAMPAWTKRSVCAYTAKGGGERLLETGCLEDALISRLSNPDHTFDDVLNPFSGSFRRKHSDPGWYQNLLVSGLFLQPGACHTEYAVLSATPRTDTPQALEQVFRAGKRRAKLPAFNPAGRRYRLSVRCLRARRADECRLSFVPQG